MKGSINIRQAIPADLNEMVELLRQLFAIEVDFEFDPVRQRRGLSMLLNHPESVLMVAEEGRKVIGMVSLQTLISTAEGAPVGLIEDLVVEEGYRGQGVGRLLLGELLRLAEERGLKRVQLLADRTNTPALEFYARHGWSTTQLIALRYPLP